MPDTVTTAKRAGGGEDPILEVPFAPRWRVRTTRLTVALAAVLMLVLLVWEIVETVRDRGHEVDERRRELTALAESRATSIGDWAAEQQRKVDFVAKSTEIEAFLRGTRSAAQALADLTSERAHFDFMALALFTDAHEPIVAEPEPGGDVGDRALAASVALTAENGPAIRLRRRADGARRLFVVERVLADSERPGTLVATLDPALRLDRMVRIGDEDGPTPGSKEALLVARAGDTIEFVSPLKFHSLPLTAPPTAPGKRPLPASIALSGEPAFGPGIDYRGVPVFAATHRIANTPFGLVVKIDQDEALASWRAVTAVRAARSTALLITLLGLGWLLFHQRHLRALQHAAQRDARYRLLLERAHDAVLVARAHDGRIVEANDAAERQYGYSREELLARTLLDLRSGTSQTEIRALLRARSDSDAPHETRHRKKDGTDFPVEVSGGLLDGPEPLVLAIVRDITERKAAELSLVESEKRYRRLFEESPVPMWIFDRRTLGFLAVNDAAVAHYGYSRERFLSMSILDIRPTADRDQRRAEAGRPDPPPRQGPFHHVRADGSAIEVFVNVHDVEFAGRPGRMVSIEDLTERLRVERALAESEQRFRSAFDDATVGMAMASPDGTLLRVNAMLSSILGRPAEELVGKAFPTVVHPPDVQPMRDRIAQVLAGTATTARAKRRLVHADGRLIWADVSGRLLQDGSGRPLYFLVTVQDITASMEAERALLKSRAELQIAIESTHIGLWDWNVETGAVEYSHEWKAMLGYGDDEIAPTIDEFIRLRMPDDAAQNDAEIERYLSRPTGYYSDEFRMRHKDGSIRWILSRGAATEFDRNGRARRIVGCHLETTERKEAERALREAFERFQLVSRASQDVVWEWDIARDEIWWSDGLASIFGYPRGDVVTPSAWWREHVHPDDLERVSATANAAVNEHRQVWRHSYRFRAAAGEYLEIEDRGFLVFGAPGDGEKLEPVRMVGAMTDVTARRRAEREVLRVNAELEQRVHERTAALELANRELESFSYSVSHDLRAPLRAIGGFTKILVEEHGEKLDADGRRLCGLVRGSTARMGELIDDLLAFSRVARQEFRATQVDMRALVESAWAEARAAEPAAAHPITFVLGDLPTVEGDPSLLRQVWINLLANAVKFSAPKAERRIEVDGEVARGRARFRVRDNGVGFDMAYADKLFGVFQRLHRRDEFEGTGVGLALVARITQRHGGRAWGESPPGGGATFYFELPAHAGGVQA